MKCHAGVATSHDQAWGHVFELPGCSVQDLDAARVVAMLPLAAAAHVSWLRRHGEDVDAVEPVEIDIVERVDATATDAQDGEFCYADDLRPLDDGELSAAMRVMAYARSELMSTIDGLSDGILDWRPPASAMARIDVWQPEPLTIREIIAGIARSESYYRDCLCDGDIEQYNDVGAADLDVQRSRTFSRLTSLTIHERARMFLPKTPWGEKPEHWTARKVVRRIIGHERFHTAEIRQRLGWLILGLPEFGRS